MPITFDPLIAKLVLRKKISSVSGLLGSIIGVADVLQIQANSDIKVVNYCDVEGILDVIGIFEVQ